MKKPNPRTSTVEQTNEIVLGSLRVCSTHGTIYPAGKQCPGCPR